MTEFLRVAFRPKARFPIFAAILILGLLVGSCSHETAPTSPPPNNMASARTWAGATDGFVFRAAYFTKGEVKDPLWEEGRIKMMGQNGCGTRQAEIVKRDVRWYPASKRSGEICAAVVYSVACGGSPGILDPDLAQVRLRLLASEPDEPFELGCGNKDGSVWMPRSTLKKRRVSQRLPSFRNAAPQRYEHLSLTREEHTACKSHGGFASTRGTWGKEICMIPMSDGGKTCADGSECEAGLCNVDDRVDEFTAPKVGVRTRGICAMTDNAETCGWRIVKGRVQAPSCVKEDI